MIIKLGKFKNYANFTNLGEQNPVWSAALSATAERTVICVPEAIPGMFFPHLHRFTPQVSEGHVSYVSGSERPERREGPTCGFNVVGGLLKCSCSGHLKCFCEPLASDLLLSSPSCRTGMIFSGLSWQKKTHLCVLSSGQKVMSVSDVLPWSASACTRPSCRGCRQKCLLCSC